MLLSNVTPCDIPDMEGGPTYVGNVTLCDGGWPPSHRVTLLSMESGPTHVGNVMICDGDGLCHTVRHYQYYNTVLI